jgi:hypothetical protein
MEKLLADLDRALEQLQAIRTQLRIMIADQKATSAILVNHAHGSFPFHDHLDSESVGTEHRQAHHPSEV